MYRLLDKKEYRKILNRLPNYQHYYNKLNYNKVDYLYCYAVPFGKKYLAWFTLYKNKETCFFIELNNQKIHKIYMKPVSFSKKLALNTIIYGVMINNNFIIENIFYYKGENLKNKDNRFKLNIYNDLFKYNLSSKRIIKDQVIFSLPIIKKHKQNFDQYIDIPYKVYGFCYVRNNEYLLEKIHILKNHEVFLVEADKINDIYLLYTKEKKFIDIGLVISLSQSKYLNSIFRKIKENNNLDLLEESDDEDMFENIEDDKYIMNKNLIPMLCFYEKKFKKWIPIRKLKNNDNVVSYDKLNKLSSSKYING